MLDWPLSSAFLFVFLLLGKLSNLLLYAISFEARFTLVHGIQSKFAVVLVFILVLCVWFVGTSPLLYFLPGGTEILGVTNSTVLRWAITLQTAIKIPEWLALVMTSFETQFEQPAHIIARQSVVGKTPSSYLLIIIPCFRESSDNIIRAATTVLESEALPNAVHIFISFDGFEERVIFDTVLKHFTQFSTSVCQSESSHTLDFHGSKLTLSIFQHGGKRACQVSTMVTIHSEHQDYIQNASTSYILFLDSDTYVAKKALSKMITKLNERDSEGLLLRGVRGVLLAMSPQWSLLLFLQQVDYLTVLAKVTLRQSLRIRPDCLPGAFSMLRLSEFLKVAPELFRDSSRSPRPLYTYWVRDMGDDRYITHLLHPSGIVQGAVSYTEAATTAISLLGQRRRWYLSTLSNEVYWITNLELWTRSPKEIISRLLNPLSVGSNAQLVAFFIWSSTQSHIEFQTEQYAIMLVLIISWIVYIPYALRYKKYVLLWYPMYVWMEAFGQVICYIYTASTFSRMFWGGPRAVLPSFSDSSSQSLSTLKTTRIKAIRSNGTAGYRESGKDLELYWGE